jgi:hypothetical protein
MEVILARLQFVKLPANVRGDDPEPTIANRSENRRPPGLVVAKEVEFATNEIEPLTIDHDLVAAECHHAR